MSRSFSKGVMNDPNAHMDEGSPRRSLEDTNGKWIQCSYADKFAI